MKTHLYRLDLSRICSYHRYAAALLGVVCQADTLFSSSVATNWHLPSVGFRH